MFRTGSIIKVVGCVLMLALFSCAKLQESRIIKGSWELKFAMLGDQPGNAMEVLLPFYKEYPDSCHYVITFDDNNVAQGYYYTFDTLNYTVTGEWEMLRKDFAYIKLDEYINGIYFVEKNTRINYTLTSDSNRVASFFDAILPVVLKTIRLDV